MRSKGAEKEGVAIYFKTFGEERKETGGILRERRMAGHFQGISPWLEVGRQTGATSGMPEDGFFPWVRESKRRPLSSVPNLRFHASLEMRRIRTFPQSLFRRGSQTSASRRQDYKRSPFLCLLDMRQGACTSFRKWYLNRGPHGLG